MAAFPTLILFAPFGILIAEMRRVIWSFLPNQSILKEGYLVFPFKPVNPKGNQSWIFIGRSDAEAETPILWPPDAKSRLIRKDPDAGKDWRQKEKGMPSNHLILCHPPFSSCLQSFPASGSFPVSLLFASGGQSVRVSASVSVLPMNIQDWFPLGLTGLLSLQAKELTGVFSNTTIQKHQFFVTQPSLWSNSHIYT